MQVVQDPKQSNYCTGDRKKEESETSSVSHGYKSHRKSLRVSVKVFESH